MKTRAVVIEAPGGPEALVVRDVEVPPLRPGEARVKQHAIGLNFIDVYHRTGLYKIDLPAVLGTEGAGEVLEVAAGVTVVAPGDRVAYGGPVGAYAGVRNVPADRLVKLPASVDFRTAAAGLMKGMTARYLVRATKKVGAGDTIVAHAAAGGTGRLVVAWALSLGARVVAITSTREKADGLTASLPRAGNALRTVVTRDQDFVKETLDFTDGRGADVVYDSVGKDTFTRSLECLAVRGLMVSYGNASGPVPTIDVPLLAKKSLFFTRPSMYHYVSTRPELEETANDVFAAIASGAISIEIGQTFPLDRAADAHRALESRRTVGSTLLLPDV